MRLLKIALAAIALLYVALLGGVFMLMGRPPVQFATAISKLPGPLFIALPFETLWSRARAGTVGVESAAPDFNLPRLDKTSSVHLASFRGERPVVLIFGSYT